MPAKNKSISIWVWGGLPFFIGVVVLFVLFLSIKKEVEIFNIEFLLNSSITCAATFTGFVLTSISILLGLGSCSIMCALREGSGFSELKVLYSTNLILGFTVILFSAVTGASISFEKCIPKTILCVGAGLFCSYLSSLLITGFVLLKLMNLAPKERNAETDLKPSSPDL